MVLLCVCGFQGSGKDTYSNYLVSNYDFVKFSFASATKDILSTLFGWDRAMLEGDTQESREFRETVDLWWSEKLGIPELTPRKTLQLIGTELFRKKFNSDIWVNCVEKKIISQIHLNPNSNIVVSDCRFPNEIKMLKDLGFKLIHIKRNLPTWFNEFKSGLDSENSKLLHESETSWIRENFEYKINNQTNNLDEFNQLINEFMEQNFNMSTNTQSEYL